MSLQVEDLIPHRGRMKLIGEILEAGEERCVTASVVSPLWPLFDAGYVSSIVLIELVAQTAGVGFGWREMRDGGSKDGRLGWLVGVREAVFFRDRIPEGARILVTVRTNKESGYYSEVNGSAEDASGTLATVTLQVFRPEE